MAITDFGSLKTAMAARAIRSDLTVLLDDFVRAAHDVVVARLHICADLSMDDASPSLPSDFRSVVSIITDTFPTRPLLAVNADQMTAGSTSAPAYYSTAGGVVTLYPTPDVTYSGRLLYKLSRTMFSADADTNTALTRYPLIYLYGSMSELFAHTRNAEERDRYLQLFLAAIDAAAEAEEADFYGNAALQSRPAMVV